MPKKIDALTGEEIVEEKSVPVDASGIRLFHKVFKSQKPPEGALAYNQILDLEGNQIYINLLTSNEFKEAKRGMDATSEVAKKLDKRAADIHKEQGKLLERIEKADKSDEREGIEAELEALQSQLEALGKEKEALIEEQMVMFDELITRKAVAIEYIEGDDKTSEAVRSTDVVGEIESVSLRATLAGSIIEASLAPQGAMKVFRKR